MTIGLIGRKCGMTRIFTESGESIPVSVIEVTPNRVTQIKTLTTDGYQAVQVTTGDKHVGRINKPEQGHFKKANVQAGRGLWEFRYDTEDELKQACTSQQADAGKEAKEGDGSEEGASGDGQATPTEMQVGSEITVDLFAVGDAVDVTGTSRGKGFAGVIKRYNFHMQDATHGNSLSHRAPGSIGQNQTPGRVFKGKKMCGHMGSVKRTALNQEVIRIDTKRNLILVKGVVPGAPGGDVIIKPSVKGNKKNGSKGDK